MCSCVFRVILVSQALIYCFRGLRASFVRCCGGFRYVCIGVNLDQVIAERRLLRRLFTVILVSPILPIFISLACFVLLLGWKIFSKEFKFLLLLMRDSFIFSFI